MNLKLPLKNKIVLIFLLSLILFPKIAIAKDELKNIIDVKAKISIGKYTKNKSSLPVTVDITNKTQSPFNGIASISEAHYRKRMNKYLQEISIPPFGKKRYFLFIPKSYTYANNIILTIKSKEKILEEKINIRKLNHHDSLFIILNRQKGGLTYLNGFSSIKQPNSSLNLSYPDPSILPEHWKSYEGCNLIYINDLPSLNLSHKQEKAILNYVVSGGKVVFSSNLDPNEFNGSIFKKFLPIIPQNNKEISPPPLKEEESKSNPQPPSKILIMTGKNKGKTLMSLGQYPILLRSYLGNGQIYFITANLSKSPFGFSTSYKEDTWYNIVNSTPYFSNINIENQMTDIPEASPPSVGFMIIIILIYGILVGPASYLYLKKKDKLMDLFKIVPILAITFSIFIFTIGYSSKGNKIITRNFSITYLKPNSPLGFTEGVYSLFSPKHQKYNIKLLNPTFTAVEAKYSRRTPPSTIIEGEYFIFKNQNIPMWNFKSYKTQKITSFNEGIDLKVNYQNQGFNGFIENKSNYSLTNCALYYNGFLSSGFELPPGKKLINLNTYNCSLSPYHQAKNLYTINGITTNKHNKNEIKRMKKNAIDQISKDLVKHTNRLLLIGWIKDDINPIKTDKKRSKDYKLNLIYIH